MTAADLLLEMAATASSIYDAIGPLALLPATAVAAWASYRITYRAARRSAQKRRRRIARVTAQRAARMRANPAADQAAIDLADCEAIWNAGTANRRLTEGTDT